jgi:hypothetical protein
MPSVHENPLAKIEATKGAKKNKSSKVESPVEVAEAPRVTPSSSGILKKSSQDKYADHPMHVAPTLARYPEPVIQETLPSRGKLNQPKIESLPLKNAATPFQKSPLQGGSASIVEPMKKTPTEQVTSPLGSTSSSKRSPTPPTREMTPPEPINKPMSPTSAPPVLPPKTSPPRELPTTKTFHPYSVPKPYTSIMTQDLARQRTPEEIISGKSRSSTASSPRYMDETPSPMEKPPQAISPPAYVSPPPVVVSPRMESPPPPLPAKTKTPTPPQQTSPLDFEPMAPVEVTQKYSPPAREVTPPLVYKIESHLHCP